ncbi:MAG: hydroxymyristoyl-ACP dehydratase [Burkholderiales bacterium]|nr:hydroxymyristoyl-ACP dehydratase [Burkholderiales bacterium]
MSTPHIVDRPDAMLAHRKPFLFVDHAVISQDGNVVKATCTFDPADPVFKGHFPGDPIVPGVLLIEFIAQAANMLLSHHAGTVVQGYLVGTDDVRFNSVVRPGEVVTAEVRLAQDRGERALRANSGQILPFRAVAFVGNKRCMRATVNIYHANKVAEATKETA